jgi:serine O-acetyltransferase
MIRNQSDYLFYLAADKKALEIARDRPRIIGDDIWKFQRLLRKVEYYQNCKKSFIWKPIYLFALYKLYRSSVKLGFSIKPNVFGPGLCIVHRGTIVVAENARIGANCRIHVCVNIGNKAGHSDRAPKIGNNVYIGPGVKIFGDVDLADGITIGANAVVNKSFLESDIDIAGVPAKKIGDKGSRGLLIAATEVLSSQREE